MYLIQITPLGSCCAIKYRKIYGKKRELCTNTTNHNSIFLHPLVSVLVVVAEKSLANVHDVLDLGL